MLLCMGAVDATRPPPTTISSNVKAIGAIEVTLDGFTTARVSAYCVE